MAIPEQILESITSHSMLDRGETIVVALSGGGDSVGLLVALSELSRFDRIDAKIVAAHLNHCLRDEDSAGDEEFCIRLAGRLKVELVRESIDIGRKAQEMGIGIEEAARKARLDFLMRTCDGAGSTKALLGHTLDDQAETVLFRAIRGTGLEGLGGMRPVTEWRRGGEPIRLVRPMLDVRRDELRRWLKELGHEWREDATNLDTAYSRNAIRLAVLPGAEKINPRAAEALSRLARLAASASGALAREAAGALGGRMTVEEGGRATVDIAAIEGLDEAVLEFSLRAMVASVAGSTEDLTLDAVDRIRDLLAGGTGRKAELPGGLVAERSYDKLIVSAAPPAEAPPWSVELSVPGSVELPTGETMTAGVLDSPPADTSDDPRVEMLDFSAVGAPARLTVRSRIDGDRFTPLGLSGSKKVKDFLIDGKVPVPDRSRCAVVTVGEAILWLAPHRLDESAKVTGSTKKALRLTLRPS